MIIITILQACAGPMLVSYILRLTPRGDDSVSCVCLTCQLVVFAADGRWKMLTNKHYFPDWTTFFISTLWLKRQPNHTQGVHSQFSLWDMQRTEIMFFFFVISCASEQIETIKVEAAADPSCMSNILHCTQNQCWVTRCRCFFSFVCIHRHLHACNALVRWSTSLSLHRHQRPSVANDWWTLWAQGRRLILSPVLKQMNGRPCVFIPALFTQSKKTIVLSQKDQLLLS